MNKKKNWIVPVVLLVLICVAGAAYIGLHGRQKAKEDQNVSEEDVDTGDSDEIVYNGKKYRYNPDRKAILFLGVDKTEEAKIQDTPGKNGQSDAMILLVQDTKKKTVTMLHISRETMTDIKIYDMSGEYLATEKAQITLQYAYGNTVKKSCQLSKEAVSNLLYGVPIRSHVSLNMEEIAPLVDAIGGVQITIPEDYTMIDPAFTQGTTMVLNGEQAKAYVHYRDISVSGSNNARMQRQTEFLAALIKQLQSDDKSVDYEALMNLAGDNLNTDLTAEEIKKLSDYTFEPETLKVPGEVVSGEKYDEFVVDEQKLYEIVIKLFYKSVD